MINYRVRRWIRAQATTSSHFLAGHVDLPGRHVDGLWSKGNRGRRLPITGDVSTSWPPVTPQRRQGLDHLARRFFTSSTGRPVTASTVGVSSTESGTRPSCHARRAVNVPALRFPATLRLRQHRTVDDPRNRRNAMLHYLSTYLGHATVESTY